MPDRYPTSAAEHLSGDDALARFSASEQIWFTKAWEMYAAVGEFNAGGTWIANGMSQLVIAPKVWMDGVYVDDSDPRATAAIQDLGDQEELFRRWGETSVVTGEMMIVKVNNMWLPRARGEIAMGDNRFYLDEYGNGAGRTSTRRRSGIKGDPINDLWRFFIPSASHSKLSSTPVSSFLDDLNQLRLLRLVLNSKLNARLSMNGIWVFGQSVQMPVDSNRRSPGNNAFLTKLQDTLRTNLRRKNDASDAMPILMQVNTTEVGDVVKQFYPDSTVDENEAKLRAEIRQTLRELLDLPVEMQTSMGSANHWGSWSITEQNLRYHLLPRARALLTAISRSWYQDKLVSYGMDPAEAAMRKLDCNHAALEGQASSDETRQAHDRGVVSDQYVRSRSRIPEDAAPSEEEYVRIVGRQLNNPYLATWGLPVHDQIDWTMVKNPTGAKGVGADRPQRAPGVGNPGSPNDPNSEVQPPQ